MARWGQPGRPPKNFKKTLFGFVTYMINTCDKTEKLIFVTEICSHLQIGEYSQKMKAYIKQTDGNTKFSLYDYCDLKTSQ